MLMAGAFIYCCVLGAQGLAAQLLPRRYFLRVSSWMQLAAFGIFVGAYFLEPKLVMPDVVAASYGSPYVAWSPSYWFLGLFEQLNGSPALPDLARRAWIAIAIAFGATASAYTLAYFAHHAQDRGRARYRARIRQPKLVAELRRQFYYRSGTVRFPDDTAQPAASSDAGVLSRRRIRHSHLFPQNG